MSNKINKAEALNRLDGDEELLAEICEIFMDDAPIQMETLKQAIADNDRTLTERQAHTIKSASANIGAETVREQASRLEQTARENDLSNVDELYEGLEQELEEVLKELS